MMHDRVPGHPAPPEAAKTAEAKDWVSVLARYRDPDPARSALELGLSLLPFLGLWALAWWALSLSGWLAVALAVANALFLVRLFIIQHDCGHGSFFRSRMLGDWVGRALGVLTLTPYHVWRKSHAFHHSASGNLDRRGIGDVLTLTVDEYRALSRYGRLRYRLYRHPLVMFGLGPTFLFLLQNRFPGGLLTADRREWISAMGTNAALALALGAILWFGGPEPVLLIFVPTALVGSSIGVWLFFVQHQFEETQWNRAPEWQVHDAALHGSSHYVLPPVLRWFSGNIGIHHVHHLYARIPFYRLTEVLRDHAELAGHKRLTLRESLRCTKFHLWDEGRQRLLSFAEARRIGQGA
jgi:acyl-lipid omega-6 desaturase (Delta-12 desaturase)